MDEPVAFDGPQCRPLVSITGASPATRARLAAALGSQPELRVGASADADIVVAVGAEAAGRASGLAPVIALVSDPDEASTVSGLGGVLGLLEIGADTDQILSAIGSVLSGLSVVSPRLGAWVLVGPSEAHPAAGAAGGELTPREREVLALIVDGQPKKAISTRLGISENTVKFHAGAILGKLGAASRAEAVMLAVRRGLFSV